VLFRSQAEAAQCHEQSREAWNRINIAHNLIRLHTMRSDDLETWIDLLETCKGEQIKDHARARLHELLGIKPEAYAALDRESEPSESTAKSSTEE